VRFATEMRGANILN